MVDLSMVIPLKILKMVIFHSFPIKNGDFSMANLL
jgi:hypothetical protein